MPDQADHLRQLVFQSRCREGTPENRLPIVLLAGSQGNVGTTHIALQLARAAAARGTKTVFVDADLQQAAATEYCEITATQGLTHVLEGQTAVQEILVRTRDGLQIVAGVPGPAPITILTAAQLRLIEALRWLDARFDLIVADAGLCTSPLFGQLNALANQVLLISRAQNEAVLDAYAALKSLCREDALPANSQIALVVNRADSADHAHQNFQRLADTAWRYLQLEICFGGFVHESDDATEAISELAPTLANACMDSILNEEKFTIQLDTTHGR